MFLKNLEKCWCFVLLETSSGQVLVYFRSPNCRESVKKRCWMHGQVGDVPGVPAQPAPATAWDHKSKATFGSQAVQACGFTAWPAARMWLYRGSWTIWSPCSGKRQGRISHPGNKSQAQRDLPQSTIDQKPSGILSISLCLIVPQHLFPGSPRCSLLWCFQALTAISGLGKAGNSWGTSHLWDAFQT